MPWHAPHIDQPESVPRDISLYFYHMKFEYEAEVLIEAPLQKVLSIFRDRDAYPVWQPGLIESELKEAGPPATYRLTLQMGRRKMPMTETILRDDLPAIYIVQYKTKGVDNRIEHRFTAKNTETTVWKTHEEFQFKGIMKLVARWMKSGFREQSAIIQNNFKRYVETRP